MSYFTPEERYCASRNAFPPQNEKGAPLRTPQVKSKIALGWLRLLRALLLDFLDLVDQIFGLLQQRLALFLAFHHVRFAPIKEVQVSHSIVVIGPQRNCFLQLRHSFID